MNQQKKSQQRLSNLKVGHAGEHFTCYTAMMQGFDAHRVSGQRMFDVIIEDLGTLYKVQVKTSRYRDSGKNLSFSLIRRSMDYQLKKSVDHQYKKRDVDLYAFVSPEYEKVAFISSQDIVNKYKINLSKEDFSKYTLKDALNNIKKTIL